MTAAAPGEAPWHRGRVALPGFGLSLGITLSYLALVVLLPLGVLLLRAAHLSPAQVGAAVLAPRSLSAFRFSFGASLAAAAVDLLLGGLLAWVLARYRFPGRRLADALVDLPFALPTAVAGIALASLYASDGLVGRLVAGLGVQVAFAPPGVVIALAFVGLPFVVRSVQPVLQALDPTLEEAAAVLGASRLQIVTRVVLPAITPALFTGFALAFARALGEYGSIVFISGNLPFRTEIVPLLIVTRLEQYDYDGATALATVMLLCAFAVLLLINLVGARARARRHLPA